MKRTLLLTIIILIFATVSTGIAQDKRVNHITPYKRVLEMRANYHGTMEACSFDIEQARQLLAIPEAKYLCVSYGNHDNKDVPILTVYDKNKNEITKYGLEEAFPCPPFCADKVVVSK